MRQNPGRGGNSEKCGNFFPKLPEMTFFAGGDPLHPPFSLFLLFLQGETPCTPLFGPLFGHSFHLFWQGETPCTPLFAVFFGVFLQGETPCTPLLSDMIISNLT